MKKQTRQNYYQRYFEGYTEEKVLREGGSGARIQRTYTGFYYRARLSTGRRVGVRVLYLALYLLTAALFLFAASRPVACNSTWYCAIPGAVFLFCMVWLALPLCSYLASKENMTIYEYRSTSLRLIKFSRIIAAALLVSALLAALATAVSAGDKGAGLRCAACFILAAAPMAGIHLMERSIDYEERCNPNGRVEH